ncbi:MAG: type I restriction enzyme HsdR N-terminal domain-containing protein [Prevotella sp.]|jgi:predicted type IV restriction endonuclease|nr:type I restriction enzyme HsdR N-terminal domain-containing protein [Prevotella sp.]
MQLNLPPFDMKLSGTRERMKVFDILRRRYVALTPEEWVRQHFVNYLINHLGYPAPLLANEVQLTVGEKHLRADTVLFSRDMRPRMIVEYKAPSVAITPDVFNQIAVYNTLLHVDYLVVSNGIEHYCRRIDYTTGQALPLDHIPTYDTL